MAVAALAVVVVGVVGAGVRWQHGREAKGAALRRELPGVALDLPLEGLQPTQVSVVERECERGASTSVEREERSSLAVGAHLVDLRERFVASGWTGQFGGEIEVDVSADGDPMFRAYRGDDFMVWVWTHPAKSGSRASVRVEARDAIYSCF